jgi:hypothetical protein
VSASTSRRTCRVFATRSSTQSGIDLTEPRAPFLEADAAGRPGEDPAVAERLPGLVLASPARSRSAIRIVGRRSCRTSLTTQDAAVSHSTASRTLKDGYRNDRRGQARAGGPHASRTWAACPTVAGGQYADVPQGGPVLSTPTSRHHAYHHEQHSPPPAHRRLRPRRRGPPELQAHRCFTRALRRRFLAGTPPPLNPPSRSDRLELRRLRRS